MRKFASLVVVFCLALSNMAFAEGAGGIMESGPMKKLGRGVLDIADAFVEIPGTMMRVGKEDGAAAGMTTGLVEGIFNTVKRALAGIWEVGTFIIPIPEKYEPIDLEDPKFLSTE
jgi:putative exosortase-associated protein (TIGR04073 family)